MTTRGGAKEKMAKVVRRVETGGISDDSESSASEDTAMALENGDQTNTEDTQPSTWTRKNTKATKAAKKKLGKKARKTKGKATKKSSTSKKVDAAAQRVLASELAGLEDKFLKKDDVARSSHPRHWTGEVLGDCTL